VEGRWNGSRGRRSCLHFAHALVDIGLRRQCRNLVRGELEHANLALLGCYLGSDHIDLLLGLYSLALDFLHELGLLRLAGPWEYCLYLELQRSCSGIGHDMTDLLEGFVWDRHPVAE
jgi:hypothetical protein